MIDMTRPTLLNKTKRRLGSTVKQALISATVLAAFEAVKWWAPW